MLSAQIRRIQMLVEVGSPPFILSNSFTNKATCNTWWLFLQNRMRFWWIGSHRLIISKHVGWVLNWNSKHSKLMSKNSEMLTARFHCNKLWIENWCFTTPLFFESIKTGALLRNTVSIVLEWRVIKSPAWLESTKDLMVKHVPLGGGELEVTSSL